MVLLVIADDESVGKNVPVSRADAIISCGDLPDEVILLVASRVGCSRVLAVKGNHDGSGLFDKRITDLHLTTVNMGGVTFGGFCGSWKYKPRGNYLFEQSEVDAALGSFPKVDVFVAHNSPRGIHDSDDEVHHGFVSFVSYITEHQPRLFLHGHQHTNVESSVGGTRVIGVYGYRYLVIPEAGGGGFIR